MRPPRPWPPWWHGNPEYFPRFVGGAEREAYEDLRALRILWVLRRFDPPAETWCARLWRWVRV